MEIDQLELLPPNIDKSIYQRICLYLLSCAKYVDDTEAGKIINLVTEQYLRFEEYAKALIIFMQTRNTEMIKEIFKQCKDMLVIFSIDVKRKVYYLDIFSGLLRQLAFMLARQGYIVKLDEDIPHHDDLENIMSNSHLSTYFQSFAREVGITFLCLFCKVIIVLMIYGGIYACAKRVDMRSY